MGCIYVLSEVSALTNTYWEDGEKEVRLGMGLEDGRRVAGIGKRVRELGREDGIRR